MVIGDFYVFGAAIFPPEDDAPLVVDSERVVSVELSPEKMKSVARGHPKVIHVRSGIDETKFCKGSLMNI